MNTEQAINGGGKFKAGPLGLCQVCRNTSELGVYQDGRAVCTDCYDALEHGRNTRVPSSPEPEPEYVIAASTTVAHLPSLTVHAVSTWTATDSEERSEYLQTISRAPDSLIKEVITNLVSSGSLELDFHKIIQNERWFSLMDLRRIASKIPASTSPVKHEKVTVKPRRKKCQKTSKIRASRLKIPTRALVPPLLAQVQ